MEPYTEFEHAGLTVKIVPDDEPRDLRADQDNLGTLMISHRDLDGLGERALPRYFDDYYGSLAEYAKEIQVDERARIMIPLRASDYGSSGARIHESSDFDDANAFIYVTDEKLREEYRVKRISKRVEEQARACLLAEISELDDVLQGYVFGYIVEDEDGEILESVWGFVGDPDASDSYIVQEAKNAAEGAREERDEERAKERAEACYWARRDLATVGA